MAVLGNARPAQEGESDRRYGDGHGIETIGELVGLDGSHRLHHANLPGAGAEQVASERSGGDRT